MAINIEKELSAGQKLMSEGEFKKALNKFKKIIKEDDKVALAWFLMAECYVGVPKMKDDDVMVAYDKAIELEEDNPYYLVSKGAFCLDVGKYMIAEESYKKAAELDEENGGRYLSEFGIEYFNTMTNKHGDNKAYMKEVRKKAATYMLKAVGIEIDELNEIL